MNTNETRKTTIWTPAQRKAAASSMIDDLLGRAGSGLKMNKKGELVSTAGKKRTRR
jgi:membrane protein involved in colicin uptake